MESGSDRQILCTLRTPQRCRNLHPGFFCREKELSFACVELRKRWMSISSNTQLSHLRETKVFFDSNVLLTNVVSPCLTLLLYVNISRWVTLFLSLWFASEKSQSWTVLHNFIPRGNMCLLPRKILAPEPETRTFRMMYLLKCHVEKAVSNIVQHLHILSLFLWL